MNRILTLVATLAAALTISTGAIASQAPAERAFEAGRCSVEGFAMYRTDGKLVVSGSIEVPNPGYQLAVTGVTIEDERTVAFDVRVAPEDPGATVAQVVVDRSVELFAADHTGRLRTVVLAFENVGFTWGVPNVICDFE